MKLGPQYKALVIKEYPNWTLVLNEKQWPYLGRCYAWWKDNSPAEGERMQPSELPQDALVELNHTIFNDVGRACEALDYTTRPYGDKFLLNVAYLANLSGHRHHMHWHFIPRSAHPLALPEIRYASADIRWGDNYEQPKEAPQLSAEELEYIRKRMADTIATPA